MKPLTDAGVSDLQVRAYGPNQPPLTEGELSRLRAMEQRAEKAKGTVSEEDESARVRASMRRRAAGWFLAAVVTVVLAGYVGYAYGNGLFTALMTQPQRIGNGIEIDDGDFRQFLDADCDLILSTEDGSLTGAHCVWDDGAKVTLMTNDSDDSLP